MSLDYFSQFPKIKYFGTDTVNITLRVAFIEKLKQDASLFYPYTIEDGDTADGISTWYYGRPDMDWLIYLVNDITDPHTQWPKTYVQFESYIKTKYGSIENAKSTISFYRKNPDVAYIDVDGKDFSYTQNNLSDQVLTNEDIRITPETYNLIDDQVNYYPVYAYDYEVELNESRRNIQLLNNLLKNSTASNLSSLLNV